MTRKIRKLKNNASLKTLRSKRNQSQSQKTDRRIEAAFNKKLQTLRDKIDTADRSMIQALARRSAIVEKIGFLKKSHGEPFRQKSRWNQLRRERAKFATGLGVDRKLIFAIFECIQKESISRQSRAKSKGPKK